MSCAAHLTDTALRHPHSVSLYITLSRSNAKRIIWPELQKINRDYKIGAHEDNTDLSLRFPNGSIIYISGANDASEIQKFRGLAIKLCYIDEAQSFRSYLAELIDDIIGPALMDHAGSLCLIGTPGPIPAGYFHDCSVNSSHWNKHAWTFFDNPFIRTKSGQSHESLLNRELERRGVTREDPTIQREWFGKWTFDSESLLLRYEEQRNHYEELPPAKWTYIMGIDLGFVDADAISVLAWSDSRPETYLVEEIVAEKQGLTELVHSIQALQHKYEISKMVIDEGGLGKKIAEELRRRHQVAVQAADKARKMENISFLNDALRTGRFKAKKTSRFAQDSYLVEIDRDRSTPDSIKVKDNYHSDIIDAVLYAFKESPAFSYQKPVELPSYGTPAWAQREVTEMERAAVDHFEAEMRKEEGWEW